MKVFIVLFCFVSSCYGQVALSDWEVDTDKDDVVISYRKIIVGDTFKTREMKVAFDIETAALDISNSFLLPDTFQRWSANAEKCELIERYDRDHIEIYCLYDAPWPFKARDMQADYHFVETDDAIVVKVAPVKQEVDEKEDVVRMSQYIGEWRFFKEDGNIVRCEFNSFTVTKPMMFTFLQDPIVQSIMIESVTNLKVLIGKD